MKKGDIPWPLIMGLVMFLAAAAIVYFILSKTSPTDSGLPLQDVINDLLGG